MTLAKLASGGFVRLTRPVRHVTALALITIVLATGGLASPRPRPETSTGFINGTGTVNIDGLPAVSGQTLFSPSEINTLERSSSSIQLRNLVHLRLAAETRLALEFSKQNVVSSLHDGQIVVSIPAGVKAHIMTADASLLTEGREPVVFTISVDGCSTTLSVQTGAATLRVGDKAHSVVAGEEFSTAPGSQATPKKSSNRKKQIGLVIGAGAAVAVLFAVLAGKSNEQKPLDFGGCVVAPSGPTIVGTCP
jgi:hypothetical protein